MGKSGGRTGLGVLRKTRKAEAKMGLLNSRV